MTSRSLSSGVSAICSRTASVTLSSFKSRIMFLRYHGILDRFLHSRQSFLGCLMRAQPAPTTRKNQAENGKVITS